MIYKTIGELCDIKKGETGIMKAVAGDYPLVTTGPSRKSCNTHQFDTEAVCIPLVSSSGHGKKSLNYVHYQSGKFALGTILAAIIPKDKEELSAEYLQRYLFFFKDRIIVPLMRGAANVSLSIKNIAKIEVPVPHIDEQRDFIKLFGNIETHGLKLHSEFDTQSAYLTQLRQAILQEAIEGKLTADWRKENLVHKGDPDYDAEALLEKIKLEKEQLILEGKIKKQKHLVPIKPEEVPFELPEGWVWKRLGEISQKIHYGLNASAKMQKKEVRLLRITDIQNNRVDWETVPGCDYTQRDLEKYLIKENDIVIARTGGTIGKTYLVETIPVKSLFASYLIRVVPSIFNYSYYLKYFFESPFYWKQLYDAAWGAGQPNVNGTSLSRLLLPLPPIAEQYAIVKRAGKLITIVDELEKQTIERKEQADMLMQTVLREAFEG